MPGISFYQKIAGRTMKERHLMKHMLISIYIVTCMAVFPFELFTVGAENIIFPSDAGVVDVTQPPFNAPNDGAGDATDELQLAINICANNDAILYFPDGVYMVSQTLKWGDNSAPGFVNPFYDTTDSEHVWTLADTISPKNKLILQGQSTDGTIIRLADNVFVDPKNPQPVIFTGEQPAQRFRNAIRNMTVDVGDGNTGAIGIQFNASNIGTVREVKIINEDRQALVGLDMSFTGQIGPCLIKNVIIKGFGTGILTAQTAINSITFEHITLEDQVDFGFRNLGQTVSIRGLVSKNSVPAVTNTGMGFMVLIDCEFTGNSGATQMPAIANTAGSPVIFARNIQTSGYKWSILNTGVNGDSLTDEYIGEYVSHDVLSLYDTPLKSLNLPVEETPRIPWDTDTGNWVNVGDYGAIPDDGLDDAAGIQAAIDAAASQGARTVYLPHRQYGNYDIHADSVVYIRGSVQRIIGCAANVCKGFSMDTKPAWVFGPDAPDTLIIEHIGMHCAIPVGYDMHFNSDKTLIMSSCGMTVHSQGGGTVFLEDFAALQCEFTRGTRVFARQFDVENDEYMSTFRGKILNDGAQLWILGLKTEREGTIIKTTGRGYTELLGGFSYTTHVPGDAPMFVNESSVLSITFSEVGGRGTYDPLVVETRMCSLKTLQADSAPSRHGKAHSIPLFVGYCTDNENNPVPSEVCPFKIPVTFDELNRQEKRIPDLLCKTITMNSLARRKTVNIPESIAGFQLYNLKGRKLWEYRRADTEQACRVTVPGNFPYGVVMVRYLEK
ncbi:MAG: endopolygalacturonase [Chitinivibrionales bacterium]|nr:endopolygalacturonase [Chitinivibrionales bacterium]